MGSLIFILEILKYCDKNNVIEREQYYMDLINLSIILLNSRFYLGYKHTPESLSKMRDFV